MFSSSKQRISLDGILILIKFLTKRLVFFMFNDAIHFSMTDTINVELEEDVELM